MGVSMCFGFEMSFSIFVKTFNLSDLNENQIFFTSEKMRNKKVKRSSNKLMSVSKN